MHEIKLRKECWGFSAEKMKKKRGRLLPSS